MKEIVSHRPPNPGSNLQPFSHNYNALPTELPGLPYKHLVVLLLCTKRLCLLDNDYQIKGPGPAIKRSSQSISRSGILAIGQTLSPTAKDLY